MGLNTYYSLYVVRFLTKTFKATNKKITVLFRENIVQLEDYRNSSFSKVQNKGHFYCIFNMKPLHFCNEKINLVRIPATRQSTKDKRQIYRNFRKNGEKIFEFMAPIFQFWIKFGQIVRLDAFARIKLTFEIDVMCDEDFWFV